MIWLDLAIAALLMWGAAAGYQMGFRKALGRLGGLSGAVLAAALGRVDLKYFGESRGALRTLEGAVHNRLAVPVSTSFEKTAHFSELPAVLQEILQGGAVAAAGGAPVNSAAMLVHLLGYTAAFLAGLLLWWALFHLCGAVLSERGSVLLSKSSRWGGALIGFVRQLIFAALIIGAAVPLAWVGRFPPGLLQLENTLLAIRVWHLFAVLRIWY